MAFESGFLISFKVRKLLSAFPWLSLSEAVGPPLGISSSTQALRVDFQQLTLPSFYTSKQTEITIIHAMGQGADRDIPNRTGGTSMLQFTK